MTFLVSYGLSIIFFFFFFSSRRRHTRSLCDWSSDVCSSDLSLSARSLRRANLLPSARQLNGGIVGLRGVFRWWHKIGRASCRERVYVSVVGGSLKEKKCEGERR